jgi:hypothetical protein
MVTQKVERGLEREKEKLQEVRATAPTQLTGHCWLLVPLLALAQQQGPRHLSALGRPAWEEAG